jgi:hypothetical protein
MRGRDKGILTCVDIRRESVRGLAFTRPSSRSVGNWDAFATELAPHLPVRRSTNSSWIIVHFILDNLSRVLQTAGVSSIASPRS